jgi:hypothetical protein
MSARPSQKTGMEIPPTVLRVREEVRHPIKALNNLGNSIPTQNRISNSQWEVIQ